VKDAAAKGSFSLAASPIEFQIKGTYGNTTVEAARFNTFVERKIALPDGVDPNKITTGVVIDPDGTVRHVPTKLIVIDGKHYAKINSLTNSTYAIVWHPITFDDMTNHWASEAVNNMGSRMVIDGMGEGKFNPDQEITRAEFAAIIVRGLGLKPENGSSPFHDVKLTDWYHSAILTAHTYGLIQGIEDGTFRPNDKITREQAMVILSQAMTITKLKSKVAAQSTDKTLHQFSDAKNASSWAQSGIADVVQSGIVSGRGSELAPQAFITRAEVAAMIERLLQKSELI